MGRYAMRNPTCPGRRRPRHHEPRQTRCAGEHAHCMSCDSTVQRNGIVVNGANRRHLTASCAKPCDKSFAACRMIGGTILMVVLTISSLRRYGVFS